MMQLELHFSALALLLLFAEHKIHPSCASRPMGYLPPFTIINKSMIITNPQIKKSCNCIGLLTLDWDENICFKSSWSHI